MEIRGISNNNFFVEPQKNSVNSDKQSVSQPKDRIEISAEARNMSKTELSPEKVAEIRKKIDSNFYSSKEVLNKVADKILDEIK